MSVIQFASALLFILSAGLLVAAERFKESAEQTSRLMALGAIVGVVVAGVLLVVDVPRIGALMDPWEHTKKASKAAKKKGSAKLDEADAGKDGAAQEDDGGAAAGGRKPEEGEGGSAGASAGGAAAADGKSGANGKSGGDQQAADAAAGDGDDDDDAASDCDGCPTMVDIDPGSSMIGAEADEPLATAAEKPGRKATIWPGFAVAAKPISVAQFNRFLAATHRYVPPCPGRRPRRTDERTTAMTCVTYDDATAYAAWLSTRTGRLYRLPSAVQWEFVARGARNPKREQGAEVVPVGDPGTDKKGWKVYGTRVGVAEFVLDCWSDKLDVVDDGLAGKKKVNCQQRILKGASSADEPRWREPWSRRPILMTTRASDVGFRVVRMD